MYRGDRTGNRYITPVSTLVKWFPLHRGFATGLAIMGFGFAALIAGPAMQYLTVTVGLAENFLILAAVYAAVMALSLFIGVLWFCGWRNEGRGGAVYDCRRRTAGSL